MSQFEFKQGLLQVLSPALGRLGYVYVGYYRPGQGLRRQGLGAPHYLFYEKFLPELGMRCWIGIQLSKQARPPLSKREFTVFLSRGRDPAVKAEDVRWKQLGTRLPALLYSQFNRNCSAQNL